jgi:hypothetical protein
MSFYDHREDSFAKNFDRCLPFFVTLHKNMSSLSFLKKYISYMSGISLVVIAIAILPLKVMAASCHSVVLKMSEERAKEILNSSPSNLPFKDDYRYFRQGNSDKTMSLQLEQLEQVRDTKAFRSFVNSNPQNALDGIFRGIKSPDTSEGKIGIILLGAVEFDINRSLDETSISYNLLQLAFLHKSHQIAFAIVKHPGFFETNKILLTRIKTAADENGWKDVSDFIINHAVMQSSH